MDLYEDFLKIEYLAESLPELNLDSTISEKTLVLDSDIINSDQNIYVPLSIIKSDSSLRSIVRYLKDEHKLSYSEIGVILNRDERMIWVTYSKSKKSAKMIERKSDLELFLPVSILKNRDFSVLESIVFYLICDLGLSFTKVSSLLNRSYQTVRTCYKRAIKKL